jgi:hypothetical protein
VATIWRNGAIKDRGTADCTVSGDFEEHSPNVGFLIDSDEFHYPDLTFISSSLVAFIGAIIIEAGPEDFVISKCDWSRYYRQLARCESMLWLQGAMTLPGGMTLDKRLIFGHVLGATPRPPSYTHHSCTHVYLPPVHQGDYLTPRNWLLPFTHPRALTARPR